MNDAARGSGPPDPVDRALDELARTYLVARPSPALAERIVARVPLTPQRRRRVLVFGPWPLSRPLTGTGRPARVLWTALIAVAAVAVVAVGIASVTGPPGQPAPTGVPSAGTGSSGALTHPTSTPTAPSASVSPGAVGTCPVTAITRVVGGTAPEVDASGLRWRWGGVPWVAGAPEKVVWLPDDGSVPDADLYLFGARLDRSIEHGGVAVTYPGAGDRTILAAGAGVSGVEDVVVPQPGCWLLTATWPGGASSVVVAVAPAPPAGASSPAPSTPAVATAPLAACPASHHSADATAQGWPGPGYVDGDLRWLTPTAASWIIGGHGDKLVLDSHAGWDIGHMAIEAVPLLRPSGLGQLGQPAVNGEIPPGFGGGTLGVGLTLPSRGCWAIAYVGSQATSTIVVDLGG